MSDNFKIMYDYMKDLGIVHNHDQAVKSDLFFDVQLIRRGKDHPGMPAANYTFKTYYIDNLDSFKHRYDEMCKCCDMFKLRAYISVNAKSKSEASKKTLLEYANRNLIGELIKPWKAFSSVCGGLDGKEKRWIIDIDECEDFGTYYLVIMNALKQCECSYDNPYVCEIPTRSGLHIITHPFNLQKFNELMKAQGYEAPGVKKNHITLLYENL